MTSDDTKYSHIAVSSDDEDDVVIHAGIRGGGAGRPVVSKEGDGQAGSRESVSPSEDGEEDRPLRGSAPAEEAPLGKGSGPADSFQETTEEDLKHGSMPAMQKGIIAVALIAIVVFVIYYNFLR